jgi:multidrug transporter EmrE-like cation transporter
MTAWQWYGVVVFIVASFLLSASAKDQNNKFSGKTVLLLLGTFLANGGTMLCQKALTYINPTGSVTLFSFCSFAVPAVAFSLYLMVAASRGVTETLNRKIYVPIALLAVALFLINQMVTEATKYVPSAILFTVPSGGNNVIAALLASLCFKEKMTVKSTIGLLLSVVSLVLVLGLVP